MSVNDASFAYQHCPFREVTHAAARRAPVIRRIAVRLWPSARRAEQVDISAAGITASGLFGSVAMGWQDVATTRRGRTPSGRRRLVVRARDGRRLEVASTLPGFERLCAAVAGHAQA